MGEWDKYGEWDEGTPVYSDCHPACACREKKVEELVRAAVAQLKQIAHVHGNTLACGSCEKLQAAIEGVKS